MMKYASSTSSITSLLSKVYQCVSQGRRVNREMFSASLSNESVNFTGTARAPTSALLRYRDGVYLVDKESPLEDEEDTNVLMELGKSMEKMLTTSEREFATYLKSNKNAPNTPPPPEAYNYAKVESFLLRSQLDCAHKKLPKQTFDLKTRATLPIRMDTKNYANNVDYKLRKLWGLHESYERERYDMVRSTLIKYNFQVRIGNMDGILIAYHNTRQIFGFEYLSLKAMDEMLFGSHRYGNAGFAYSVKVLGRILDWVTAHYWGKDIRLTVKANVDEVGCRGKRNYLEVYAELLSENGKENENKKTKRSIKRFEFEVSSNKDNMGDYSSDDVTDWWVETTMSSVASYDPPATNSSTRKPARSQLPVSVAPGGDVDGYDNADEIDDTFFGVKRGNIVGAKLWKEYQAVRAACPNLNVGGSGNEAYVRNLRKVVAFDDEVDTRELRRIQ
ncbi:hypothetical protein HK101_003188 [Irineochytrium annulatum]|nr:hypothetical protein HK101_003188 [Irineochytrium annulatum]